MKAAILIAIIVIVAAAAASAQTIAITNGTVNREPKWRKPSDVLHTGYDPRWSP